MLWTFRESNCPLRVSVWCRILRFCCITLVHASFFLRIGLETSCWTHGQSIGLHKLKRLLIFISFVFYYPVILLTHLFFIFGILKDEFLVDLVIWVAIQLSKLFCLEIWWFVRRRKVMLSCQHPLKMMANITNHKWFVVHPSLMEKHVQNFGMAKRYRAAGAL